MTISLLNSKAASKGSCNSGVAASYRADVTSRGADAIEIIGHGDIDGEVLLLGLRESVGTRDVVRDLELGELGSSITGLIKITLVGAGTISIDLENYTLIVYVVSEDLALTWWMVTVMTLPAET